MICLGCGNDFKPNPHKKRHRFCTGRCRSAYHRREGLPGVVKSLRQLKDGSWNVIVNYPTQPPVSVGASVCVETE